MTVDWADAATVMSDPPFAASVFYNSVGIFGSDTSYVFMRPQLVGFPSGTTIRFALDANGLTSAYGEPMIGPTEISVATEPLSIVSLPTGGQTVPTGFLAPVAFSTRVDPAERAAVLAVRTRDGGRLAGRVHAGPRQRRSQAAVRRARRMQQQVARGGAGRNDVRRGLPDAFGRPLPTAVSGNFMTSTTGAGRTRAATSQLESYARARSGAV